MVYDPLHERHSQLLESRPTLPGAVDGNPLNRPGVPHESKPPARVGAAYWTSPDRQTSAEKPLVGQGRALTPVYSTANPPRGLSGVVRRFAYTIPDYRARRWMLLLLADRIDVLEHNPRALIKLLAGVAAVGVGVYAVRGLRDS